MCMSVAGDKLDESIYILICIFILDNVKRYVEKATKSCRLTFML